ncbi:facilitated trehalose transporter Tret1-2 homolog isoform X3 [Artemia franciscana]|uniref:facilitated trehalose transporter Tret1-2 homolog isoform X3 n=1 Tax=Artemia franciscana TaxID=6661 RepID=UPI0032DAC6DC
MSQFKNAEKVLPQVYPALAVGLAMFCLGFDQAWSSPAIPSLKKELKFNLSETDLDIISSFLGALCVGMLINSLGRRGTVMALSPLYIGSYLLTGFAVNRIMIITGRFICGFLAGAASPASQIYVSEISSPCIRGRLGSLAGIFLTVGILVAYGFGAFLNWNQLSLFGITFPALLGLSTLFIPESPSWYIIKQKDSLALKSLQRLRGRNTDVSGEFKIKKESSERIKKMPEITLRNASDPKFWKPLALSSMLMIAQQFSGNLAVVFNTVSIFESTGSTLSPSVSSVITGSIMVIFTIGMTFLIDKAGRKALLLFSSAGMGLSHSLLGSYFYIQANYPQEVINSISWLPLVSLITFFIFYALGYNGIPFMMLGELLPLRYRGICSSLSGAVNRLFAVIVVITFPLMQDTFGKYGCYWFYSACCCLSTFSVFYFVPETKGKSLEEIETLFETSFTSELIDGIQNKAFSDSSDLDSKL